jgi:hypothetical protein
VAHSTAYLLVAVLKDARAASRLQAAIEPIYNHFYRHDFLYHYSYANCARISSDILRAIGWRVPQKGVTGDLKAAGAFAYLSVKDLSFASGQKMVDFLNEEQMRLFPRKAFEAASEDLLAILKGQRNDTNRTLTDYEQALRDDTLAVLFIRVPQIPSSRTFGTYRLPPSTNIETVFQRITRSGGLFRWTLAYFPRIERAASG